MAAGRWLVAALVGAMMTASGPATAQNVDPDVTPDETPWVNPETGEPAPLPAPDAGPPVGAMTLDRLDTLITAVDGQSQRSEAGNGWELTVAETPVTVVCDPTHDRMRIMVGIAPAADLDQTLLYRMMQANFDSALDARYAIARDILWATFIHPLSPLTDRQFLEGLGQTVNVARTFGSTFTSGALTFQGGDSQGLIERALIDQLLEKGQGI